MEIKKLINLLKIEFKNSWYYLVVVLAIVLPWFLKSGFLFFTDFVWGPNLAVDWRNNWFLIYKAVKLLSHAIPLDLLQKLFFSLILVLVLSGGRKLVKEILSAFGDTDKNKSYNGLIFILSLFALFNPFVYDRFLYGQIGIVAAFGFLCLAIGQLLSCLREKELVQFVWLGVYSGLMLMFSMHFVFFLAPFFLLFLAALYFKREEIKKSALGRKLLPAILASVLIVCALNANWIISTLLFVAPSGATPLIDIVQQGITQQDLAAFQTAGKTTLDTYVNVIFMSGFWGKDQLRYLDLTIMPGWQRGFVLLLPIIIYGVYLSFRKRSKQEKVLSAGLLIIFSVAVFLAVGFKALLTRDVILFLYNHVPFYKGLREPQKWVAVIIPIYLFYLTLGAYHLSLTKLIKRHRYLSGIILAAIIVMLAPFMLWGFNGQVNSTPYPADWYETDKFLLNNSNAVGSACDQEILFLPWHAYMGFSWAGKVISNPAPVFFTCPVLSGTNMDWGGIADKSADGVAISDWIAAKGKNGLPMVSGAPIHYIILAKEVDWSSYRWLKGLEYLNLIKETPSLLIYEIKI